MKKFIHEKVDLGYDDLKAITLPSGRTYIDPEGNRYPSIDHCTLEYLVETQYKSGDKE